MCRDFDWVCRVKPFSPVVCILKMDGSSVGEHVVVALLLVCAGRYVAQVMDDARLVVLYSAKLVPGLKKEELKLREKHLSVEPSIGNNGATILTSKPGDSISSVYC